ncbi:MAG TPA: BTAD domain-containing putative transcriptional regulator [Gemmatimonadales bacterium]|nr:BTAD domain-containing putative transcriptional regulator [Gemmatimonadales bacterium]
MTGGREATAALAQPKRVALLAYLAAASPYGFHHRDTILALFWPDADKHHARTALRKAIHFLRHEIGPEVVASRGDEELGIVEEFVWCDVREFDRRLASGRDTEALALYRGDLLPGFFIPDAPEFERWLDEERLRLRSRAADAAWALAGRLERERDAQGAERWARWGAALTPDDERAVRRLIALLGRLGDRAGAIRAHDELAARLRREYDVAPSAETEQLVDAVRRGAMPATAAARAPPSWPEPPEDEALSARPATGQYIAVFPFPVHGDGSAAYLHEGLVDLLSTNLDHAGALHSIDPHALLSRLGGEGASRLDPERASEVAAQFGAQLYVSGSVVGVAGRLRISAALHYRTPGASARFVTVAGAADRLFDLVDDLTSKLLAELHPGPGARLTRLAATTTGSLPALKAYLAGERALRGARYEEAIEAFEQAVTHDPEFALGWYRLAFFLAWPTMPQPHSPWESMERALGYKQRLSEHDRMLLEALSASLDGRAGEAERIYRELLSIHPEDVEAWLGLGQTLVFHNQQRGRLITESRGAFERVLTLDPGHTTANLFLCYVAELEGNTEESDRRIAASPSQSDFVHPRIVQAFRGKDREAEAEAMAFLRAAPDGVAYEAVRFVATLTHDFAAANRIARLLAAADRPPEMHGIAHILTGFLELAAGRRAAARRELARAAPLHPAGALEYRGLIAALPFLPADPGELHPLREALAGWDAAAVPRMRHPNPAHDLHRDAYPVLRLYLLGVLAAREGDAASLDRAAELDAAAGDPDIESLARDLALGIRARLAAVRGDREAALGFLERARMESRCTYVVMQSPFYTYTAERWLRAELLQQLERYEEALRWYASIVQSSLFELAYLAPSHLNRARIHDRLGDRLRAASHYRRVLAAWNECDPELRPVIDEAAGRLQRMGSGARRFQL